MSAPAQSILTPEDFGKFLLTHALYQKLYVDLPMTKLPLSLEELLPTQIYFECNSKQCERSQPFRNDNSHYDEKDQATLVNESRESLNNIASKMSSQPLPGSGGGALSALKGFVLKPSKYGVYFIRYRCSVCWHNQLLWWVQIGMGKRMKTFIQKVGQLPAYDISISRDVEKKLSENDLKLYKQALVCISQNYGIGACIYLRRLIENQIDTLLGIQLETRQSEGAGLKEIETIKGIMEEKMLENKIKLVTQPDPETGINVVGRMYDKLSDAIHNRTDDECTTIAKQVAELFDEVLVRLKQRQESQRAYLEKIKVLDIPERPRQPS